MSTFTDDFERADGSLGANWDVVYGNCYIQSGIAYTIWGMALVVGDADGDTQAATIRSNLGGEGPGTLGFPTVQANPSTRDCYYGAIEYGWYNERYARIYRRDGANSTQLVSVRSDHARGRFDVRLTWHAGHLSLAVDGEVLAEADDSTYTENLRIGVQQTNVQAGIEWFQSNSYNAPELSIVPALVSGAAGQVVLTATLSGAAWTVSPPSTTFTCDHGEITGQILIDPTHALIFWTVYVYPYSTTTFTESEFSLSDTVDADAELPPDYGQGYGLTPESSELLIRTGLFCPTGRILTTCESVDTAVDVKITEALDTIIYQLGGFPQQQVPDIGAVRLLDALVQIRLALNGSIDLDPEELTTSYPDSLGGMLSTSLDLWRKADLVNHYTVAELIELLGGTPTIYSNADIITAIENIQVGDNQDVLDRLDDIQGNETATISATLTAVNNISVGGTLDLDDVMGAIDDIPATDLTPVLNKLNSIQPTGTNSLDTIISGLLSSSTVQTIVTAAVAAILGEEGLTLALARDAILDAIQDAAEARIDAPVWPGEDKVTLGTPRTFSDTLEFTEDMDGVIITITSPPGRVGHYVYGTEWLDHPAGYLSFGSDRGDLEPQQKLGFRNAIYTPRIMRRAASVHIQGAGGASGTVTPWVISESA